MARKKKVIKQTLPDFIELISTKSGVVKEFKSDHAFRLLTLQKKIGLGSFDLFNTHLYRYEDSGIRFIETEHPNHSLPEEHILDGAERGGESLSGVSDQ